MIGVVREEGRSVTDPPVKFWLNHPEKREDISEKRAVEGETPYDVGS